MQFDTKQRQDALRAFIKETGIKVSPWEEKAGLGEGTVRNFLKREKGTMTDRTYESLAAAASKMLREEVTPARLRGAQAPPAQVSVNGKASPPAGVVTLLPPLVLYRSAAGSARGGNTLIYKSKQAGEVDRLKRYEFAHNAFCIEATDDLMAEFARTRDLMIVDPDRIPKKGDACLFVRDPHVEPLDTVFRHLVDILPSAWLVREYNGRKTNYELSFADYPQAWPVGTVIRP